MAISISLSLYLSISRSLYLYISLSLYLYISRSLHPYISLYLYILISLYLYYKSLIFFGGQSRPQFSGEKRGNFRPTVPAAGMILLNMLVLLASTCAGSDGGSWGHDLWMLTPDEETSLFCQSGEDGWRFCSCWEDKGTNLPISAAWLRDLTGPGGRQCLPGLRLHMEFNSFLFHDLHLASLVGPLTL